MCRINPSQSCKLRKLITWSLTSQRDQVTSNQPQTPRKFKWTSPTTSMANPLSTRNWMTSSTNSSKPKMRTTSSSEGFSACNRNLQILISILVNRTISTSVNLKAFSWNPTSHSTKAVLWETWTKSSSGKSSLKQALRPATSLWRNSWQLARRSRIRVWM